MEQRGCLDHVEPALERPETRLVEARSAIGRVIVFAPLNWLYVAGQYCCASCRSCA